MAQPVRRRPGCPGQGPAHRQPALHRRRRDAAGVRGAGARHEPVAADRVQPGGEVRRAPPQQQLVERGTAQAGRDTRAGAGPGRRAQRGEPGALSAVQGAPGQRRLPHPGGPLPGPPGSPREADPVPAVGRRELRAADRVPQRREPGAGAGASAGQGDGHAPGARGAALAARAAARGREPAAHGARRRFSAWGSEPPRCVPSRPSTSATCPTGARSGWTRPRHSTRSCSRSGSGSRWASSRF